MLENKAVEFVEDPKLELKIDDKPGPEVIAKLVSQQEVISPRPMKAVDLPIETLIDLSAEPSMDLGPTMAAMKSTFFLRSPDVYDPPADPYPEASFTGDRYIGI